jgi:glycosyltransferase involved in cell wall biosynthesis
MKVALVYDRVNKMGGAERVLMDLHRLYPDAPLYTLVYSEQTAPWARNFKIIPSFFNQIKFFRNHHEILAPFAASAFETFDFREFDLVISVTSAEAKSVITKPETLHICYCLTPTRYLWSANHEYRESFPIRSIFDLYLKSARTSDLIFANRPDYYLSISKEVQRRIEKYYLKKSDVIYPAIDYDFFSTPHQHKKQDYYLVVNRLVPYKKTDIVIEAFNQLDKPLKIVGIGSEETRLKKIAGDNIDFLGNVDDVKLRQLYAKAKAIICPQDEDFGLTPLEAAAAGTPALAYKSGGYLETIIDNDTGLFFEDQTKDAIISVINRFEAGHHQISLKHCREQAALFGKDRFTKAFSAKVNQLWQQHQKTFM